MRVPEGKNNQPKMKKMIDIRERIEKIINYKYANHFKDIDIISTIDLDAFLLPMDDKCVIY